MHALNEHVLNKYALRTVSARLFRESPSRGRDMSDKRGVVRPEVLCHAHNHGSQIQTLKKKLHKLNTNAQYIIVAMSQTTTVNREIKIFRAVNFRVK